MIKKILLLSLFSCILFFTSCAGSPSSEEQNKPEAPVGTSSTQIEQQDKEETLFELTPENTDESENINEFENEASTSDNNQNDEQNTVLSDENIEENEDNSLENPEENQQENSLFNNLEQPVDFDEPLVRDLDISLVGDNETDTDNLSESDEEKPLEEPVDIADIYPESTDGNDESDELSEDELSDEQKDNDFDESEDFSFENEYSEEDFDENNDVLSEEDDENVENVGTEEEIEEEIVIIPSRSVSLRKGENLVIIYPGSGWIYMGSLSEYSNMASKGRKLGSKDTKYTLLAKEAGTQIHHFYKVDNLTGEYIDDYLEITVLNQKGSSKTTITAPEYVEVVPQKPEKPAKASVTPEINESEIIPDSNETVKNEQINPENTKSDNSYDESDAFNNKIDTPQNSTTENKFSKKEKKSQNEKQSYINIPENQPETNTENQSENQIENINPIENTETITLSEDDSELMVIDDDICIDIEEDEIFTNQIQVDTDELLDKAQNAFIERNFAESYNYLSDFFEYAIDRQDEALFLQGQLLETDSEIKDIKGAIQAYELLVKNYPSSSYWNDANKRIKYLKKFYYFSN